MSVYLAAIRIGAKTAAAYLFMSVVISGQAADSLDDGPDGCDRRADCVPATNADPVWVEESLNALSDGADSVAIWVDSFFGTPEDDVEATVSRLRVRLDYTYDQDDGSDVSGGIRGKIYLPSLDNKLSIIFESDDASDDDTLFPAINDSDTNTGLQYSFFRDLRESLSLSASVNSSLDLRSALRYRVTYPLDEHWSTRLTERLYYREEDGFGSLSRVDLDYSRHRDALWRWTNDADYGEGTDGVEWNSILGYWQRFSSKDAVNYFTRLKANTDPDTYVESYGVGLKYRRNLWKPWFFVELEPSHAWKKEDYDSARESVWSVMFRIEFVEQSGDRRGVVD